MYRHVLCRLAALTAARYPASIDDNTRTSFRRLAFFCADAAASQSIAMRNS